MPHISSKFFTVDKILGAHTAMKYPQNKSENIINVMFDHDDKNHDTYRERLLLVNQP